MHKIALKLAKPGMKLAKPVLTEKGVVLVGAGIELSEGILRSLENKGVEKVAVEGNPLGGSEVSPERRIAELEARFRNVADDPVMMNIKNLFIRRIREAAAEDGS